MDYGFGRVLGLNDWRDICHQIAKEKGFHDEDRTFGTSLMLIVSELGEAIEGHRKGDEENVREEIADAIIRIFDLCGLMDIDISEEVVKKVNKNKNRPYKHNKKY